MKQKNRIGKLILCVLLLAGTLSAQESDLFIKQQETKKPGKSIRDISTKLFSMQSASVLKSLDLNLYMGGAFGFEGSSGFLGVLTFGLGGYGEVELGTASLLGSIFGREESFGNISLKARVLTFESLDMSFALGLRSNNKWNSANNEVEDIKTASPNLFDEGLRRASYDSRMTSLYAVLTKNVSPSVEISGGVSYSDLRYKNVTVLYGYGSQLYLNDREQQKNDFNFFVGLQNYLNPQTSFMLEVQSSPFMQINSKLGTIDPAKRITYIAGIRFLVLKWLYIDTGVRYQDNYRGLADTEVKIGLNGIWNVAGN